MHQFAGRPVKSGQDVRFAKTPAILPEVRFCFIGQPVAFYRNGLANRGAADEFNWIHSDPFFWSLIPLLLMLKAKRKEGNFAAQCSLTVLKLQPRRRRKAGILVL